MKNVKVLIVMIMLVSGCASREETTNHFATYTCMSMSKHEIMEEVEIYRKSNTRVCTNYGCVDAMFNSWTEDDSNRLFKLIREAITNKYELPPNDTGCVLDIIDKSN